MREFWDAILSFIESESLTDEEFDSIELESQEYTKESYEALKAVVEAREGVSGQAARLKQYFLARGVDLSESLDSTPKSQIFIGDEL